MPVAGSARYELPPNGGFPAFLPFLSWRFSLSDLSGTFLALGFFGDLSGTLASSFHPSRYPEDRDRSFAPVAQLNTGKAPADPSVRDPIGRPGW